MSSQAQVLSIERLERLKEALIRLISAGQNALALAETAVRRTEETLEERLRYWQQQVVKAREAMIQARAALAHARALHEGKSVGCVEQEMDLRKAQERVRHAEEKVAMAKRWLRDLPLYLKEYEGPARGLGGYLETDVRQSIVLLDNKVTALNAYLNVASSPTVTKEPS